MVSSFEIVTHIIFPNDSGSPGAHGGLLGFFAQLLVSPVTPLCSGTVNEKPSFLH